MYNTATACLSSNIWSTRKRKPVRDSMKRLFLVLVFLLCAPALSRASVISDLAASMSAGDWAEVTGMSPWSTGIGFVQDPACSSSHTVQFTHKMVCHSVTKKLFFLGQSHVCTAYQETIIYDAATTNGWTPSSASATYWNISDGNREAMKGDSRRPARAYWQTRNSTRYG